MTSYSMKKLQIMMLLKSLLHKRAIAIILIPGVSIFILEFTAFRPFGYNRYAININRLILTLSYTLIGSGLFYYVNVIFHMEERYGM